MGTMELLVEKTRVESQMAGKAVDLQEKIVTF
jgi:hypothetical protein